MSDDVPDNSMGLSDLDGFLTGILCFPELIMPSEWLPVVWGEEDPEVTESETHIWAIQEILQRYNDIAAGLNAKEPFIEPIYWQALEGHEIAMDWCEGFMDAFGLRHFISAYTKDCKAIEVESALIPRKSLAT